jgi:hypothetical protein
MSLEKAVLSTEKRVEEQLRQPVLSKLGGQQKSSVEPELLTIKQSELLSFVFRSTA